MVQRDKSLDVYLWLRTSDSEASLENFEEQLKAFLTGLAFATGQNCWPSQVTIQLDGGLQSHKIFAVRQTKKVAVAPFSERISFNSRVGQIEWDFDAYLGKAALFFGKSGNLSQSAAQALWLLRASNAKGTPGEITLMALCVLLESLSGLIFDELHLESAADDQSFNEAKIETIGWLNGSSKINQNGYIRLRNCIQSQTA